MNEKKTKFLFDVKSGLLNLPNPSGSYRWNLKALTNGARCSEVDRYIHGVIVSERQTFNFELSRLSFFFFVEVPNCFVRVFPTEWVKLDRIRSAGITMDRN